MNILLWAIQIILGIKLMTVTYTHGLSQYRETMQAAIQKMGKASRAVLYGIAICTLCGTLGLILPGALGKATLITPVTAAILAIMLLISIFVHMRYREKPKVFVSVVLFAFAVFVAYGRWVLAPY
jgi:hypothetical protein